MEGVPLCPGSSISLMSGGNKLLPCPSHFPKKAPSAPVSSLGAKGGQHSHSPHQKCLPFPCKQDPLPAVSAELHLPPGSAPTWLGLSSFSSLSHSLNALCLLWQPGQGEPLSPLAPGDPPSRWGRDVNVHTAKLLRGFAGAPFIASLCVLLRCGGTPPSSPPASLPSTPEEKKMPIKALFVRLV